MTSLKKSCSNIPSSFLLPLFLDIVVLVSCWDQGCLETYKVKSSGAYLIAGVYVSPGGLQERQFLAGTGTCVMNVGRVG